MRIKVHLNGHHASLFVLKVPPTWGELETAMRQRLNVAGSSAAFSRPLTRLFLSADGAEIASLEDLQEGDVVAVSFDGQPFQRCGRDGKSASASVLPDLSTDQQSAKYQPTVLEGGNAIHPQTPTHDRAEPGLASNRQQNKVSSQERALRGVRRGLSLLASTSL